MTTQLSVDEEESSQYNISLGLQESGGHFNLHRQEGVHIGGIPEYLAGNILKVHRDYSSGKFTFNLSTYL